MDITKLNKITLKKLENALWLQRYIERVESHARVMRTYYMGSLDHARFKGDQSHPLLALIGFTAMSAMPDKINDFSTMFHTLMFDKKNISSIYYNLEKARSNGHLIRNLLNQEAWVSLNTLWLWFNETQSDVDSYRALNIKFFFEEIISQCQLFYGIIHTNQREDELYDFMQLGSLTERACQTARLIDTTLVYTSNKHQTEDFSELLWPAMLETRSALESYHRLNGHDINDSTVIRFLLFDPYFPLSVEFCIKHLKKILVHLKKIPPYHEYEQRIVNAVEKMKEIREQLPIETPDARKSLQILVDSLHNELNAIK